MTFTDTMKAALGAKLDASHVKQRDQGRGKVSYIEGWHAIDEANRIFGFDGWTRETVDTRETNRDLVTLKGDRGEYQQWRVGYVCRVRVVAHGVTREGTGYGSGMGRPEALGDAVESAIKEAETDAMKRALMTFGNPFGLALYDKAQENVEKAEAPKPPAPAKPAPAPADAFWGAFWKRDNYELKGANIKTLADFAKGFKEACRKAQALDALLKLEEDNGAHLAALKNEASALYAEIKNVLGTETLRLTQKAA